MNNEPDIKNKHYAELEKIYMQIQVGIQSDFNSKNYITKNESNSLDIASNYTVFGFEAEFAQSVYGREEGQTSSKDLPEDQKTTSAALEFLFHTEIEKAKPKTDIDDNSDVKDIVGEWNLGTDYYDVLEFATPAIKYDVVWENKPPFPRLKAPNQKPWKRMVEIGQIWKEALYLSTSERFYEAMANQTGTTSEHRHKEPAEKTKTVRQVLELLRGTEKSDLDKSARVFDQGLIKDWSAGQSTKVNTMLEAKNYTLHPAELPNSTRSNGGKAQIKYDHVIQAKIQRNFLKNGVSKIAPQYNVTLPATCALELIQTGSKLQASFDSKYLSALDRLHLGFRKFLTSKLRPEDDIAHFIVTIAAYYMTNITGLPSQIRGDIRVNTKFAIDADEKRKKQYLTEIAAFNKNNKGYENNAYCYTHSWIKDVAHTWVKADGPTLLRKTLECLQNQDQGIFLEVFNTLLEGLFPITHNGYETFKQALTSGDISDPLIEVAKLMDYEFPDRRFIHLVLNPQKLTTTRKKIFENYKPGAFVECNPDSKIIALPQFSPEQYEQSGYEQILWALTNCVLSLRYHVFKLRAEATSDNDKKATLNKDAESIKDYETITWCRQDTYQHFQKTSGGLYSETHGLVVTEIRDDYFLNYLNGDLSIDSMGG